MNAQGTEEWALERCGRATASEFSSVLAKGDGKTRKKYLHRVVAERLTGKPIETYRNANMERGIEQEPLARLAYESKTGNIVEQVGFVKHPTLMTGCSPDGLIESEGGVEIKSVIPTVQMSTVISGGYPSEHRPQVQGSLWITGRQWWDFCSYSQDMPAHLRLYIFRVERDHDYIKTLADEVTRFLDESVVLYNDLMRRA